MGFQVNWPTAFCYFLFLMINKNSCLCRKQIKKKPNIFDDWSYYQLYNVFIYYIEGLDKWEKPVKIKWNASEECHHLKWHNSQWRSIRENAVSFGMNTHTEGGHTGTGRFESNDCPIFSSEIHHRSAQQLFIPSANQTEAGSKDPA